MAKERERRRAAKPDTDDAPPLIDASGKAISLRTFASHPAWLGLDCSPAILAIYDASEGIRPDTITDDESRALFGCDLATLPTLPLATIVVRAGGRGGKTSRLLAVKALHAALTAPLPTLAPGEHAAALIVSSELIFAHQALSFVKGYVEASPRLAAMLRGQIVASRLTLCRPHDGHKVDVRVRAAGKGGKGGRAITLAFGGMDESCFFDSEGAAVSDKELFRALSQRLVPGAQCWIVSTPWVEGEGLLEEKMAADFGQHTHSLCVQAPTRTLNPGWDPDRIIEAPLRETDPDNAAREIDAIPLASGIATFFAKEAIDAAVDERRPQALPYNASASYFAGGDFAFRRNSSALCILERLEGKVRLALRLERKPERGVPLKSSDVCAEFAGELVKYQCREVVCDSHERADVSLELGALGISVVAAPEGQAGKVAQYKATRTLFHEGHVSLPKDARLTAQLKAVKSKPLPGGGLSITSPTSTTGEHGDIASSFVAAAWHATVPPVKPKRVGEEHYYD